MKDVTEKQVKGIDYKNHQYHKLKQEKNILLPLLQKNNGIEKLLTDKLAIQIADLEKRNHELEKRTKEIADANKKLIINENRFRQIADNVNDIFWIGDMTNRVLFFINKAVESIFGISADSVYENFDTLINAVHNEDRNRFIESLSSKSPVNIEYRIIKPDGEIRWLRSKQFPVKENSCNQDSVHIAGIITDITEYKNAEQRSKYQQQQLIEADRMASLGVLVSGVAHEINNPNNFISLNAPMLLEIFKDILPILEWYYKEYGNFIIAGISYPQIASDIISLINGIDKGSKRIKKIVADLKNYARHDDKNIFCEIDINKVVKSSIVLMKSMLRKKTNIFQMKLYPEPLTIYGNFNRLEQVLINLLQNACDSLTSNTQGIIISTSIQPDNHSVIITISDQGCGIKPEHISKLTDPFFTTKRDIGGTGLGLPISAGIIKDHGGEISFNSKPGAGTTVTVIIPWRKPDNA